MLQGIRPVESPLAKYMSSALKISVNALDPSVRAAGPIKRSLVEKANLILEKVSIEDKIRTSRAKLDKIKASKQGKDAIMRFNNRIHEIDYWHVDTVDEKKVVDEIVKDAKKSLASFIDWRFGNKLSQIEKADLNIDIINNYVEASRKHLKELATIKFSDIGQTADGVIKSALEREEHYQAVGKILVEADFIDKDINDELIKRIDYGDVVAYATKKATAEGKLTAEQIDNINKEFEMARVADECKLSWLNEKKEAEKHNIELAKQYGPKPLAAYKFLMNIQ